MMEQETRPIRIAVVQSLDGVISVCGPNDYSAKEHGDAMNAAYCWLTEQGEIPADRFWVTINLPTPSANEIEIAGQIAPHHA